MRENVSHAMLMYLVSKLRPYQIVYTRTHSHSLVSSLFLPRRTLKALSLASSQRNSLSRSHFCTHATHSLSTHTLNRQLPPPTSYYPRRDSRAAPC